jgi:hypothetical protein
MSSKSRIETRCKALSAVLALGAFLAGCSDIYYDRRETVTLGAADHIASNMAIQMVDPWPRYVGDKNIAFNGERLQAGVQRYRRHEVIQPRAATTTSSTQPLAPTTTEAIAIPHTTNTTVPAAAVK